MLRTACAAAALASARGAVPDSGLNASQIFYSAEVSGEYVGSPSIATCGTDGSVLVASHDLFGASQGSAFSYLSKDGGSSWTAGGVSSPMYWATLFVGDDKALYLMGTTSDCSHAKCEAGIARSADCGATWSATVELTAWQHGISTGPTPVLQHAGRWWRAYERNDGAWAAGYGSFVLSAPVGSDLMSPASWNASGILDFSSVLPLVPASWSSPLVASSFGWLEGNAVEPVGGESDSGINIVLRVNSIPAANKAALLYLANATGTPSFVGWIDPFPGGMTKFTIRRDPASGLYVTLSNFIQDDSVTAPPVCGAVSAQAAVAAGSGAPLPCCNMQQQLACAADAPACVWCHANSRNNLTLATSPDLRTWTVAPGPPVMADDSGLPEWARQLWVGFQYVDFQVDGDDLLAAVRAGYRGAQCYHNANRLLFTRVSGWRARAAGKLAAPSSA